MGWSAYATQPHGPHLPTTLVDGQLELMDRSIRAGFHRARDRVLAKAGAVDAELYRGGLSLHGSGRVLSFLAGHGGSIAAMNVFTPEEVVSMSSATDLLDPGFILPRLLAMGFDPDRDPLAGYFWSATEFARTCALFNLSVRCDRY